MNDVVIHEVLERRLQLGPQGDGLQVLGRGEGEVAVNTQRPGLGARSRRGREIDEDGRQVMQARTEDRASFCDPH